MSDITDKKLPRRDKGSYRHMLDLASAPNFREIINGFLEKSDAQLAEPDCCNPRGRLSKKDWTETSLEDYVKQNCLPQYERLNRKWWIPFKGNRPTWDLLCHIKIEKKPGLLIVEAKAHHGEMIEKNSKSAVDEKNERSVANDLSIRLRLAEASIHLNRLEIGEFKLSADHDYQLSNRLAYLQKLASDGVPTVLMYLGWIESPDWVNDPFTNTSDWNDAVMKHFERVGPWEFAEKKHQLKMGAPFQMIVRSLNSSDLSNIGKSQ